MRRALLLGSVFLLAYPSMTAADQTPSGLPGGVCSSPTRSEAMAAANSAGAPGAAERPVFIDGVGSGGFPVKTSNPEAQRWFDQGLRLAYGYDYQEAQRAFREAQRLDPTCAMCVWGEAWAKGPTLNYPVSEDVTNEAGVLAAKALAMGAAESEKNRALMEALRSRYNGETRLKGNKAYADAMDALAKKHPDDLSVQELTIDAILVNGVHDTTAKGVTNLERALELTEKVLAKNPNSTAAIHFYIHGSEFAEKNQQAVRYAEQLGRLAPRAGHLVHMPSHTFFQVGRYQDAATSNARAVDADVSYTRESGRSGGLSKLGLHRHNIHFGVNAALMAGDGPTALRLADHFAKTYPAASMPMGMQGMLGSTYYAYGQHADPAKVLAMKQPPADQPYMQAMWRYARGEALARKGSAAAVRAEAAAIDEIELPVLAGQEPMRDRGMKLIDLSRLVLLGRAATLEGRHAKAAAMYRKASSLQESMNLGRDPPMWWFPVRRSYAAALMASGDLKGAEAELATVLKTWPDDPMALQTLGELQRRTGRQEAARATLEKARRNWAGDPSRLSSAIA